MSSSYLKTKCNRCGEPKVSYNADKSALVCSNCKHVEPLPKNKDSINELKLGEGFDMKLMDQGLEGKFKGAVCMNCGAFVATSLDTVWESCPFCAHPEAEPFRGKINTIRPAEILPFNYPKARAVALFQKWARGLFAPASLIQAAREPHVKGIYIPFWNFEVMTRSSWKAVQLVDGGKGKKSKQPVQGYFAHFFDDLRLFASHQIDPHSWDAMGSYPLEKAVVYDSKYLEGMHTEIVQQEFNSVLKVAEKQLEKMIRTQITEKSKGKSLQNLAVRSEKQLLDAKLLLLPVWVATYDQDENLSQVLINGFSGEMHAERPYSMIKVALGVLVAVLGLIGFIILLNKTL